MQTFVLPFLICTYTLWVIYSELKHLRKQGAIKQKSGIHEGIKNTTTCKSWLVLTQAVTAALWKVITHLIYRCMQWVSVPICAEGESDGVCRMQIQKSSPKASLLGHLAMLPASYAPSESSRSSRWNGIRGSIAFSAVSQCPPFDWQRSGILLCFHKECKGCRLVISLHTRQLCLRRELGTHKVRCWRQGRCKLHY